MAYFVFVDCDNSLCDQRAEVPEKGSCPLGWLQTRHQDPDMPQPVAHVFCGWNCAVAWAFGEGYIQADSKEAQDG